jgi:hypothetical protein
LLPLNYFQSPSILDGLRYLDNVKKKWLLACVLIFSCPSKVDVACNTSQDCAFAQRCEVGRKVCVIGDDVPEIEVDAGRSDAGGGTADAGPSAEFLAECLSNAVASCAHNKRCGFVSDEAVCTQETQLKCAVAAQSIARGWASWSSSGACQNAALSCGFSPLSCGKFKGNVSDGAACQLGTDCSGGLSCNGTTCPGACGLPPVGEVCTPDRRCAAGAFCPWAFFGLSRCSKRSDVGESCGSSDRPFTQNPGPPCNPGLLCSFGSRRCVELPKAGSCFEGQCAEGLFCGLSTNVCSPKRKLLETCDPSEASCDRDLRCDVNKCVNAASLGAPCNANVTCLSSLRCVRGACMLPLENGKQCLENVDCKSACDTVSKKCSDFITDEPPGAECGQRTLCARWLVCRFTTKPNGTLAPGACGSTQSDDPCLSDVSQCSVGQRCLFNDGGLAVGQNAIGACRAAASNGVCRNDSECPPGDGCAYPGVCLKNIPLNADCAPAAPLCEAPSQCRTGRDGGARCIAGLSQPCSDTAFGTCNNGTCSNGICLLTGFVGGPCNANSDCAEGKCNGDSGVNSQCIIGDAALGSACRVNSQCGSGVCRAGVCVAHCD